MTSAAWRCRTPTSVSPSSRWPRAHPRQAIAYADAGLGYGDAPHLFVANLLVVRAAREAFGDPRGAAADYHRALTMNEALRAVTLERPEVRPCPALRVSRAARGVVALLVALVAVLGVACATGAPSPGGASAVTPEERDEVDALKEAIGAQGRALYAAQASPAPDCARVCLLVGNICALAQKICGIAGRYPEGDPIATDCVDARARCQHARDGHCLRLPADPLKS